MAEFLLLFCFLVVFPLSSDSLPEPGKLQMKFSKDGEYRAFSKALYKGANISVKGQCKSDKQEQITIKWKLKYTQCADFFLSLKDLDPFWGELRKYELHGEDTVKCNAHIHLTDRSSQNEYIPPNENATVAVTSKYTKVINLADENIKTPERKFDAPNKKEAKIITEGTTAEPVDDNDGNNDAAQQTSNTNTNGNGNTSNNLSPEDDSAKSQSAKKNKRKKDPKKDKKPPKSTGGIPAESVDDNDDEYDDNEVEQKRSHTNRKGDKKGNGSNKISPEDDSTKSQKAKKKNIERRATNQDEESISLLRVKREGYRQGETAGKLPVIKKESKPANENKVPKNPLDNKGSSRIASTKRDGIYLLIVKVVTRSDETFQLELDVSMESKSGYLSATDWPLLPFYGIMSLVYLFCGISWFIMSAYHWNNLLEIQFWIGGAIALGMLEKVVFYSAYNNSNNTGISILSLVIFAEIVSVSRRTLYRILLIILSMGLGNVKPRLTGKSFYFVLCIGALYFILAIVEGCLRSLSLNADPSKEQLIAGIPLAILDFAIVWWIWKLLARTIRTLSSQWNPNSTNLSLYRHFSKALIFAVLVTVAYMIWSIKTHKFADCIKDWSELWLDEAFWHFLSSIILLAIMVLWRPSSNHQRYAFRPIVDFDDDQNNDITLYESFDAKKIRTDIKPEVDVYEDSTKKASTNEDSPTLQPVVAPTSLVQEDDLKWVEKNIPSSAHKTIGT